MCPFLSCQIVIASTANGDDEVMFRVPNDCGTTFADKINLDSNTSVMQR